MTGGPSRQQQPSLDIDAGISQVEGYLLAQSRLREAAVSAEMFAGRMPWLTTAQYDEVVRLYAEEHIAVSRKALEAITARAGELRTEYSGRYDALRQRLLCRVVAALIGLVVVWLCVVLLTVRG
ncbi:hypothetical protein ACFWU3_17515 [Streptomyces sp. NPDC058685]|uniref:hypothetical protein n=1 Tax=Streptomyces sp. NPDC058685 TaxID=3346598 RepID=UPI00364765D3